MHWIAALLFAVNGPALEAAQAAYVQCLSAESDAALRERVPADLFASGIGEICVRETGAYRAAALPVLLAQQPGEKAANERFAVEDAANRARLSASYGSKMRARGARRMSDQIEE